MKYLLMVVLLCSFNQARAGAFYTGNEMLELCERYLGETNIENVAKGNICAGYIIGIFDVHDSFVSHGKSKTLWCSPGNINTNQLVRIVTKFMQERPGILHFAADSIIINALSGAFPPPCV